jgi:nondiscriminating glutamyl-tRNA synthetase
MVDPGSQVRVRFAPSPTGDLHVGNVRTAIFNWLYARKHGGTFILRIEDTDQERSSPEAERSILEDMHWLGFEEDEGVVKGGAHAPYRQSERKSVYQEHARRLMEAGHAYLCYCTEGELEEKKKKFIAKGVQPRYDGTCRDLAPERRRGFEAEGRKPSIRFRIEQRDVVFEDLVRGRVSFSCAAIGDFIIVRSDGMAAYNFSAAVDDALMRITHVFRGEDHLSNTPRQILILDALQLPPPHYGHLSIIVDNNRAKLKKREPGASFRHLRQSGFLADAIINYLALLGWSPPQGGEFLQRTELIEKFTVERCIKSPAMYDLAKLRWLNAQHLRTLAPDRLLSAARPFIEAAGYTLEPSGADWLGSVLQCLRDNIETLDQLSPYLPIFLNEFPAVEAEAQTILQSEMGRNVARAFKREVEVSPDSGEQRFAEIVATVKKTLNVGGKSLFMPIRASMTGLTHGPELARIFSLLRRDVLIARLERALAP